jgi:ABC-type transporter MlaC component
MPAQYANTQTAQNNTGQSRKFFRKNTTPIASNNQNRNNVLDSYYAGNTPEQQTKFENSLDKSFAKNQALYGTRTED